MSHNIRLNVLFDHLRAVTSMQTVSSIKENLSAGADLLVKQVQSGDWERLEKSLNDYLATANNLVQIGDRI